MSLCLFNLYAEYIMQKAGLDESQAGIKIAVRSIHNLRYADNTTFVAESKEELKSLLMRMKQESEKSWLKTQHSKTKIIASCPRTSPPIEGEKMKTVADFIFLDSKTTVDGDQSHEMERYLLFRRIAMTNLDSVLKGRYPFADKGSYSQSYGFSSSHVLI